MADAQAQSTTNLLEATGSDSSSRDGGVANEAVSATNGAFAVDAALLPVVSSSSPSSAQAAGGAESPAAAAGDSGSPHSSHWVVVPPPPAKSRRTNSSVPDAVAMEMTTIGPATAAPDNVPSVPPAAAAASAIDSELKVADHQSQSQAHARVAPAHVSFAASAAVSLPPPPGGIDADATGAVIVDIDPSLLDPSRNCGASTAARAVLSAAAIKRRRWGLVRAHFLKATRRRRAHLLWQLVKSIYVTRQNKMMTLIDNAMLAGLHRHSAGPKLERLQYAWKRKALITLALVALLFLISAIFDRASPYAWNLPVAAVRSVDINDYLGTGWNCTGNATLAAIGYELLPTGVPPPPVFNPTDPHYFSREPLVEPATNASYWLIYRNCSTSAETDAAAATVAAIAVANMEAENERNALLAWPLDDRSPSYCERVRDSRNFRQPWNSWSNFGYFIVFIYIMLDSRKQFQVELGMKLKAEYDDAEKKKQQGLERAVTNNANFEGQRQSILSIARNAKRLVTSTYRMKNPERYMFAFCQFALFVGSLYMHASWTHLGQFFDNAGIYIWLSWIMVVCFGRTLREYKNSKNILYVLALAWNITIDYLEISSYREQIPGFWEGKKIQMLMIAIVLVWEMIMIWLAMSGRSHRMQTLPAKRWFFASVIAHAVAFICQTTDNEGFTCYFNAGLHGIWHLLSAFGGFCLYKYFRSEKIYYLQTTHAKTKITPLK